jgi:hypothetical protein
MIAEVSALVASSPWEEAVGAFFAVCLKDVEECGIHSKLLLSDSGKAFVAVKNPIENYRCV